MEDFPVALIFALLAIVSSAMKAKKKKEQNARKQVVVRPQKAPAQNTPSVPAMSVWKENNDPSAIPGHSRAPVMGREGTDACHDYMLPKRPAVPAVKTLENHVAKPVIGVEGEDSCHEFMLNDVGITAANAEEKSDLSPQQAQELVRGIILSEILARPQQRYWGKSK